MFCHDACAINARFGGVGVGRVGERDACRRVGGYFRALGGADHLAVAQQFYAVIRSRQRAVVAIGEGKRIGLAHFHFILLGRERACDEVALVPVEDGDVVYIKHVHQFGRKMPEGLELHLYGTCGGIGRERNVVARPFLFNVCTAHLVLFEAQHFVAIARAVAYDDGQFVHRGVVAEEMEAQRGIFCAGE